MSEEEAGAEEQTIGDYKILKELGRGGMGEVYLAQHAYLKKRFALKVLPKDFEDIPGFSQMFQKEAQTLGTLKHPNIVEVHNFGVHEGSQYLVMDYVDGGTIDDYHERCNRVMPEHEVISTLQAVMAGLQHAHELGIIHRDLKPENFLLDSDGVIKITDFGIAQLMDVDAVKGSRMTQQPHHAAGETMVHLAKEQEEIGFTTGGTEGYMAPEVEQGSAGDKRCDFYAIGVIAYYLLTGIKPTRESEPVTKARKGIDKRWHKLISKCMKENPDDRYSDSSEIILLLNQMLEKRSGLMLPVAVLVLLSALGVFLFTQWKKVKSDEFWEGKEDVAYVDGQETGGAAMLVEQLSALQQNSSNENVSATESLEDENLPPNDVSNSGFENGLSNWESSGEAEVTVERKPGLARSGEYIARIKSDGNPTQTVLNHRNKIEWGDRVVASAWVMTEAISDTHDFTARLRLTAMNQNQEPLGFKDDVVHGEGDWRHVKLDLIVMDQVAWPDVSELNLELMLRAEERTVGIAYFDDVRLSVLKPDHPDYAKDNIF